MDKHQIALYFFAIAAGCLAGIGFPSSRAGLAALINPLLCLLLYVTFLSIPLTRLVNGWRDFRFMSALLVINFILVPAIVFILTRFVQGDKPVLIGIALVLLAPCIDYVIVFSGLARGASHKLLATTPLLLLAQMALIPLYMIFIVGKSSLTLFTPGPFIEALILLIFIPLLLALATQVFSKRWTAVSSVSKTAGDFMVPAMMGTLFCVSGSQIISLSEHTDRLFQTILIFTVFALVAGICAFAVGRLFRLSIIELRAATFSGVTRNSLVVLPIALALPKDYSMAATVVVTQTLVELVAMIIMIKAIPRMIKSQSSQSQ
ncbi:arsenic resistance protein [Arthrobacter sp. NIO-1057]|uniref:arsenic resistance protein n=1 Tax=Arthrobacter sp. NIO-1057 TaxID=993071 RepID=UPI00071D20ED|nr:bile acid:sodium symporter [Arthrobacter sp. NIO-1057]KSU67906.1 arsenic resistance protein [Arthrobacter sp. NIO-1057]SCB82695.1 Arsenite efflux pump ArsB, ACR3 family [Arthrobacter sp. NIO-1057]